ncbi:hypothetical protein TVAG_321440 [Trichomonas vaginalis G3]|uniref:Glycosyltransferase 61 catalytic domain-containing protein n=1 Tax=Trichomonas vaginalis (strain ATCC PRA-98 / G3) TaxID=412133 RepID=A2FK67_TRIV3|nr:glycosyltransferase family [Trichomonas vaginalis G3]EAX94707.1 hypothetical protein TVAG_321440 [Trichomonas vaginalis G3]KAI5504137.1 glycosyltransferase family [Trichomonas vaginalis G3]|eukprot:XP_001307637.1 hypothetical protein [Trichomonas vaginalis G3]
MEIPEERIIRLKPHCYYSCDICSTIANPISFINAYGIHSKRLQLFLHEKYNLDRIKPTRYVFMNREYDKPRYIKNMDEIFNETKKAFPDINWENQTDIYNLTEAASVFASIKFMYSPTGSNIFKCYLMHPFSVMVVVSTRCADNSAAAAATHCDIFMIMYAGNPLDHHQWGGAIIDVKYAIEMIRNGLICLRERKIPNIT